MGYFEEIEYLEDFEDHWTTDLFKRKFSATDKDDIWERCGGKCAYCGKTLHRKKAVFDHVTAWRKGGHSLPSNGAASCQSCNMKKAWRADKEQPYNYSMLFFRRVHENCMGRETWGAYLDQERIDLWEIK